jgi:hypothetical protein
VPVETIGAISDAVHRVTLEPRTEN